MLKANAFIGAVSGFVFVVLITSTFFSRIKNAKRNVSDNKVYIWSWLSLITSGLSGGILVKQIQEYSIFTDMIIIGVVVTVLLTGVFTLMFYYTDKTYIKGLYVDKDTFSCAPWLIYSITALVSAFALVVVIGWLIFVITKPIG